MRADKVCVLLLIALVLALALPAVPSYSEKVLIIGTTDKISKLDPAFAYDFFTWEIFNNINEGLLKYVPGTLKIVPGLAESYSVSKDGLVYTIKLRPGLKFTDGTPLTAKVVKWSIERVARLGYDVSWFVTDFVKEVKVVDDLTLKIILKQPVAFFPAILTLPPFMPVSPKAYPENEVVDSTVSIGPYKIVDWKRDEYLILEANPDYYGEPPKTKKVIVKFYKDATTLRLAIEKGEIDIAWRTLNPVDIMDLEKKPDLKVIKVPGPYIRYVVINVKASPLNNVLVRRALAAAIDRKEIASKIFLGLVTPLYSMIPAGMWSHVDCFKDAYGPGPNLELAKKLLSKAGYSEKKKLKIELWYTPTHYGDTEVDLAQLLKEQWERTGMIEVTIKSAEWGTYTDYIEKGVMPVFLLGWYPDYIDPDDYIAPFMAAGNRMGSYYESSAVDGMVLKARTTLDRSLRTTYYVELQGILANDVPFIPLFQGQLVMVTKKNVKGVILDATMLFRYWLVYKE